MLRALAAVLCSFAAASALAQAFPARPVKIVVPAAPGGTIDILARTVQQPLGERLGQPVIVENRAGGGTNVGNEAVARAAPDGYTLLLGGTTIATNPALYANLAYDPQRDLAPIALMVAVSNALVVNPAVPAASVQELIGLARAKPGALNFASAGTGSSGHLAAELFKALAGIDVVHVSYKGAAPAHTDLLGGQVQAMFDNMPASLPLVRSGKLRALATTGARRSALMPELPTMVEAGVVGFESSAWFGMLAPGGTPASVVERVNRDLVAVMQEPLLRERLVAQGFEVVAGSPETFRDHIAAETEKWGKVIRAAGIKGN